MSIQRVFRSGVWLYLGTSISSIISYFYWFIASTIVAPDIVGSAAAVISLYGLLISTFSLGLPAGLQRFLSISDSKRDYASLSSYFSSALGCLVILNIPIVVIVYLLSIEYTSFISLNSLEVLLISILVLISFSTTLFQSFFISLLKTESSAAPQIISSISKLVIGYLLLTMGFGFLGLMSGFIASSLVLQILLVVLFVFEYRRLKLKVLFSTSKIKDLFQASLPAWAPNFLSTFGQSLGVLFIYSLIGQADTGLYFLALAVASVVTLFPASLQGMMYPYLSSMVDEREVMTIRMVRLSMVLTAPFVFIVFTYSSLPFSILGSQYMAASLLLSILVLSGLIAPIVSGYFSYAYARGEYKNVTILGLSTNISRVFLYLILIIVLGALGASISYTIGMLFGLLVVIIYTKRTRLNLRWSEYAKAVTVPLVISIPLILYDITWILGIPILLFGCLIIYARMSLLSKDDIRELAKAFLSDGFISRMYPFVSPLIRLMFGNID